MCMNSGWGPLFSGRFSGEDCRLPFQDLEWPLDESRRGPVGLARMDSAFPFPAPPLFPTPVRGSPVGRKWSERFSRKQVPPWVTSPSAISIPVFSRRYDSFLTPIEIAPFCFSDPTPSSRSDLWYVPKLRTYLHYERSYLINVFFIRSFGEPRLRFGLPAKASVFSRRSP